ncbi:RNA polymerase II subunit A C-terminal domain phosphatase [Culicoides brevitarsis]|uniref:RNA polymerase II subunit A C-terminal domain phosphatase n=1 Tax=Culicoides brevitarsis TaxID=469753 RepID=UPI00307B3346
MSKEIQIIAAEKLKINKWKIREGSQISNGNIVLLYHDPDDATKAVKRLKSNKCGVVKKRLFKEGDVVDAGVAIVSLSECSHTTVIKDMCADCGADLRHEEEGNTSEASVPMIHSVPELKVTQELAEKLGKADTERLLGDKKLVLLVDLDQTLIHTTNDNIPNNLKDVYHFQLYPNSPWYHTRLRPGALKFLANMHPFYELHICTFGARNYAHMIAQFLDEDGKFFSQRILSRDECFNLTSKKDNLKALFPCGDAMVCIIDDREDVWNMATNLIQVKPYHFFQHTGDINAPPELSKHELDGTQGVDFKEILNQASKKRKKQEDEMASDKSDGETSNQSSDVEVEMVSEKKDEEAKEEEKVEEKPKEDTKSEEKEEKPAVVEKESKPLSDNEENLIEVEDPDDYLLYLEIILKKIHAAFYEIYDKDGSIPDLKTLIPNVKAQVLVGKNLVFSGIVPNHIPLEQSRPYKIAKSLGATVMEGIDDTTTHLVAACSGTFKVHLAKKNPNIKLVAPEWLWSCAERWESVEEQLFPMPKIPSKMRQPPPHCSPDRNDANSSVEPAKFMDTINPLLSFSNDELDQMDNEFNEFFDGSESDDSEDNTIDIENPPEEKTLSRKRKRLEEKPNASDFFTRPEVKKINLSGIGNDEDSNSSKSSEEDDESPSVKFRRGEVPSDVEDGSSSKGSDEAPDDVDDGEWNMMGAALEREFLGLDE